MVHRMSSPDTALANSATECIRLKDLLEPVARVKKKKRETCACRDAEKDFFIGNLLVRIHFIIEMIRWTGFAPWESELSFPGSLTSALLGCLKLTK